MGPIQVIPPGLMGLLQLKQEGKLPGNLSETVAPVIELRDWYLTARRVDAAALFGGQPNLTILPATAIGFVPFAVGGVTCQVPGTQIWWVEQLSIRLPGFGVAATDFISIAPVLLANATTEIQVGLPITDRLLVARQRNLLGEIERGFWAYPGDQFGLELADFSLAAGNLIPTLRLRATPCPI